MCDPEHLPLIAIFYVEHEENGCHENAQDRTTGQNRVNCQIHLTAFDDAQRLILRRRASNPTQRVTRFENQFILNRIEFPNFGFSISLELLQQNVGTSFIVIKSNWTLWTRRKWFKIWFTIGQHNIIFTVTPSKLVFFNASRNMFSQSLTRYSKWRRNCSFRFATYWMASAAAQMPS